VGEQADAVEELEPFSSLAARAPQHLDLAEGQVSVTVMCGNSSKFWTPCRCASAASAGRLRVTDRDAFDVMLPFWKGSSAFTT